MTTRTTTRPRWRRVGLPAIASVLVLALGGCATAESGTGVPDGDAAARYVSGKFSAKLAGLSNELSANEPRKSELHWFGRIDDKKADQTVTAVQLGSPPSRLAKDHSNRDSNVYIDWFHPAGSPVEYALLGPAYRSLAPTPWVSLPYDGENLGPCFWVGYQTTCKMLQTVADAVERGNAAKQAKSLEGGGVELSAEVTLRDFLKNRVIVFPDSLLTRVTEPMKDEPIATTIMLDPRGELRRIEMNGRIAKDGHEVEVRMKYEVLAPPTENDLPEVPDPAEVTVLPDEAAVDDFYRRLAEVRGS